MDYNQIISHPLVTAKSSEKYPNLVVMKYKKKVFFDNLWDDVLSECRGHVYDKTSGERVVNSFTKVFNRFERDTDIPRDETVTAVQKINGFMAAVTYVPSLNECVISTTGSLDSDFVGFAREMLSIRVMKIISKMYKEDNRAVTWLFEIVHPEDPHIIKEKTGAYLIGCRYVDSDDPYISDGDVEFSLDVVAEQMGVHRPKWKICRFSDVVQEVKTCKHEGFVVYSEKTALKMKSPYYLSVKLLARKKDIMSLDKSKVDEEYFALIDYCKQYPDFNEMEEQDRIFIMRTFLENQTR
jgi:hypothetical protein